MSIKEDKIEIEVNKTFSFGFYPKKKIFVPRSSVQNVVEDVESKLNAEFKNEKAKLEKETIRKIANGRYSANIKFIILKSF